MKDLFGEIYNTFLLRDLLGYVVPGGFVLICIGHLFSLIIPNSFPSILSNIPDRFTVYAFGIGLSYACGHFLSGIFFHTPLFRWLFRYIPKQASDDHPETDISEAWATHRFKYKRAASQAEPATRGHIERHAALVHFTGHFSASLLFGIFYIAGVSIYLKSFQPLVFCIPLFLLFPGLYSHYRQLLKERYQLEKQLIEAYPIPAGQTSA